MFDLSHIQKVFKETETYFYSATLERVREIFSNSTARSRPNAASF